ncbi:hypothetical protein P154DRAFT_576519 [Amniculicola lignicola CBS 123094]|uniref:Uncharacterized protein n=1 Tax=Amniculicola lignicola CBS 123094 TaxID=1392246 RepID=A0A6A5WDB2_9PLEO|nr:hypothetical protein P154DRAFT_576519 [Amniculicola lignicola CBS 123094]
MADSTPDLSSNSPLHTYASLLPILVSLRTDYNFPIPSHVIDCFERVCTQLAQLRYQVQTHLSQMDNENHQGMARGIQILDVLQMAEEAGVEGWVRWLEREQGLEAMLKIVEQVGRHMEGLNIESTVGQTPPTKGGEEGDAGDENEEQTQAGDEDNSTRAVDAAGLHQLFDDSDQSQTSQDIRASENASEAWKMVHNVVSLLATLQARYNYLTAKEMKRIITLGERIPLEVTAVMHRLQEQLLQGPYVLFFWEGSKDVDGERLMTERYGTDALFRRNLHVLAEYLQRVLDRVTFDELMAEAWEMADHQEETEQAEDNVSVLTESVEEYCGETNPGTTPHSQNVPAGSNNLTSPHSYPAQYSLGIGNETHNTPQFEDQYTHLLEKSSQQIFQGDPSRAAKNTLRLFAAVRSRYHNLTTQAQGWFDFLEDKLVAEVLRTYHNPRKLRPAENRDHIARSLQMFQHGVYVLSLVYVRNAAFKFHLAVMLEQLQRLLHYSPCRNIIEDLRNVNVQRVDAALPLPSTSVTAEDGSNSSCDYCTCASQGSPSTASNVVSMVAENGSIVTEQRNATGFPKIHEASPGSSDNDYSTPGSHSVVDSSRYDDHIDNDDIKRKDFGRIDEQRDQRHRRFENNGRNEAVRHPIGPYVHITLSAGFTIPDHTSHAPNITFPSSSHVFHFPFGATRDGLLDVLRCRQLLGFTEPVFEPPEAINIIPIRTRSMELELKIAIERKLGGKGWDLHDGLSEVGGLWEGVGSGTTFLISGMEVHFNGVSNLDEQSEKSEKEEEEGEDELYVDAETTPRLRGGDGSTRTTRGLMEEEEEWHKTFGRAVEPLESRQEEQWYRYPYDFSETSSETFHDPAQLASEPTARDSLASVWMQVAQTQQDQISVLENQVANLRKQNRELRASHDEAEAQAIIANRNAELSRRRAEQAIAQPDQLAKSESAGPTANHTALFEIMISKISEIIDLVEKVLDSTTDPSESSVLSEDSDEYPEDLPSLRGGGNGSPSLRNFPKALAPSLPPLPATGFVFNAFTSTIFLDNEGRAESENVPKLNRIREILEFRERMPLAGLGDYDPHDYTYAITDLRNFGTRNADTEGADERPYHGNQWDYVNPLLNQIQATNSGSSSNGEEFFHDLGDLLNDLYNGYDSDDDSSLSYPGSECSEPFEGHVPSAAKPKITTPPKNGHDLTPKVTPPDFSPSSTHPNIRGGGDPYPESKSTSQARDNQDGNHGCDYLGNSSPPLPPRSPPSPLTSPLPVPVVGSGGCVVIDSNMDEEDAASRGPEEPGSNGGNDTTSTQPTIPRFEGNEYTGSARHSRLLFYSPSLFAGSFTLDRPPTVPTNLFDYQRSLLFQQNPNVNILRQLSRLRFGGLKTWQMMPQSTSTCTVVISQVSEPAHNLERAETETWLPPVISGPEPQKAKSKRQSGRR